MRSSSFRTTTTAVLAVAMGTLSFTITPGCQNNGDGHDRGKVVGRDQNQQTNPDGSQTRTRTQVRETKDGQTVKETETQHREVAK